MVQQRNIIEIDEERCDGCGQCVTACQEGAIAIIDGKAKLISETYCDGLGACIGECPQGAIKIEQREAKEFDPAAVEKHLSQRGAAIEQAGPDAHGEAGPLPCGCPGTLTQALEREAAHSAETAGEQPEHEPSALTNWPVQLMLVPVNAPYFDGARLLIAADCVPFAFAGFHRHFLVGRVLLVGCPKLDDAELYRRKLAGIFAENEIKGIEVAFMEVPCCFGLLHLVRGAVEDCGKNIPVATTKIAIRGEILERSGPQEVCKNL